MRNLVLLGLAFAIAVVALRRPVVGLLSFVGCGFLNPQVAGWGALPLAQIVATGTIVGYALSPDRKGFPWRLECGLLAVLWIIFGWSTAFAMEPGNALDGLIRLSKILLMVFLSVALINSRERLLWLMRVIGLSIGFYGAKGGAFVLKTGGEQIVWGPEGTFIGANNALGLALVMNLPILLYLAKTEKNRWMRWIVWVMLLLSYPAVIGTFSRGAWLGLAVVSALMLVRGRHIRTMLVAAGVLVVLLPLVVSERVGHRYDQLVNYEEDRSAQSRLWSWTFCARVGLANPLTGGGFGLYSEKAYERYYPEFLVEWPGKVWSCHSAWFSMFAEHGFPGLMTLSGLVMTCFVSLWRMRRRSRGLSEDVSFLAAIEGALVGFVVVSIFYNAEYFDLFYQLVAVVAIAKGVVGREDGSRTVIGSEARSGGGGGVRGPIARWGVRA